MAARCSWRCYSLEGSVCCLSSHWFLCHHVEPESQLLGVGAKPSQGHSDSEQHTDTAEMWLEAEGHSSKVRHDT